MLAPASPANTTSIIPPSIKKHISAGPIAGGVVGGLLFIALIAGLVLFLIRRKNLPRDDDAPPDYPQLDGNPLYPPVLDSRQVFETHGHSVPGAKLEKSDSLVNANDVQDLKDLKDSKSVIGSESERTEVAPVELDSGEVLRWSIDRKRSVVVREEAARGS